MSGRAIQQLIARSTSSDFVFDASSKEESPLGAEYHNFTPKWVLPYLADVEALSQQRFEREGAVLSLDIVGFTRLTGLLGSSSTAEGGENISNILNIFFGKMIAVIEGYGGDTIQFSGDAIMAIFTQATSDASSLEKNSQLCVDCAIAILKSVENSVVQFMSHTIDLGIKLGISCGTILHVVTGGYKNRWMVLHSGEVWNHSCTACDGCPAHHALVHSSCLPYVSNTYGGTKNGDGSLLLSPPFDLVAPISSEKKRSVALSKRQQVLYRGFIPRGIKRLRPETRMINTMFVKFCDLPTPTSDSVNDLFTICNAVQTCTSQHNGSLNKVLFDDKGLLALICFGVTGHVHSDDATRSASLALELIRNQPAFKISIGITSGRVFCGVLGNNTRAEYTLLGDSVNLAARLMTYGASSQSESSLVLDDVMMRELKNVYSFKTTTVSLKGIGDPVNIGICDTTCLVPSDINSSSPRSFVRRSGGHDVDGADAVGEPGPSNGGNSSLLTVDTERPFQNLAPMSKNLRTVAATNELWFKNGNRKRSTIGGETVKLVRTGSKQLDSLVGRSSEIAKLDESLCSMHKSSTFKVLVLKGNPGVGKTTFLLYCVHNFKHPSVFITFSQETRVYGGIETLLTSLSFKYSSRSPRKDDCSTKQGEVCPAGWLQTVAPPNLQYLVTNLQSGLGLKPESTEDVVLLIEAALKSHCKNLGIKGMAIVIDGIQWLDWTSLNLIQESIKRISHKIMIICSYTTGFADAQTTVCSDLSGGVGHGCKIQQWFDSQQCEVLELGPMTRADAVLHYRHYIQTGKVDADLSDVIYTNSEGSPLLAEIIINHLIEQDLLGNSAGVTVLVDKNYNIGGYLAQLPQIISIVTRQLDHIMHKLGESASRFLKVLSLMEHLIDSRLVTELFENDMTPDKSQRMCAQLIGSKILKVTERQKLCFSSMLLPKVLQNNMLVSEKKEAHMHIANVMERLRETLHFDDTIIANHFHQADMHSKAKEWYERSLDFAWTEHDFFGAHKLLNILIELENEADPMLSQQKLSRAKRLESDNSSQQDDKIGTKYDTELKTACQDEWLHMLLDLSVVLGMKKSVLGLVESWCKTSVSELQQLGTNERSLPWLTWALSHKYSKVQSMPLKEFLPVLDLAVLINNRDLYIGAVGAMAASKRREECNSLALISIYNAALAFKLILLGNHSHAAIAWTKVDVYNKVSISTLLAMLAVKGHMYTKRFTPKIISTDARGTYRADCMMLLLRVVFAFLDGKSGCSASYADAAMHLSRKTRDKSFFMTAMLLGRVVKLTFSNGADPNAPQVVTSTDDLLCLIKQPEWSESTDSVITFMSHSVASCDSSLEHPLQEAIDSLPDHVMNPLVVPVLILLIDTIWQKGLSDEEDRVAGLSYLERLSLFINQLREIYDEWGDGLRIVLQYARCSLGGVAVPTTSEVKNIENNARTKFPIMFVRMRVITSSEQFRELVVDHVEDLGRYVITQLNHGVLKLYLLTSFPLEKSSLTTVLKAGRDSMEWNRQWFLRLLVTDGMSEVDVLKHKVVLVLSLCGLLLGILAVLNHTPYGKLGGLVSVCSSVIALVRLFVFRSLPPFWMRVMAWLWFVSVVLGDFARAAEQTPRSWPLFILLIDFFLIIRLPHRDAFILMIAALVWLVISVIEDSFRFGLYDIKGTPSYSQRTAFCDCEAPPCAGGLSSIFVGISSLAVFVCDFVATRGFAASAEKERYNVEISITTSRHVAQALAEFDLKLAESILHEHPLPQGLLESFTDILSNLKKYRPYLPPSCIPQHDDEAWIASIRTPLFASHDSPSIFEMKTMIQKRVSLLVVNMNDTIFVESFVDSHSWLLLATISTTASFKGLTDTFMGDHIHASFNAARSCINHTCAAVDSALSLFRRVRSEGDEARGMTINIAVGSGTVTCGDLGCEEMRRFSIVGKLPLRLAVIERLGRKEEYPIVADMVVYKDVEQMKALRLIPHNVLFIREGHEDEASFLYEVMLVQEVAVMDVEWMYQLEMGCGQKWARYNEVGMAALRGKQYSTKGLTEEEINMVRGIQIGFKMLYWCSMFNNLCAPCFEMLMHVNDTGDERVRKKMLFISFCIVCVASGVTTLSFTSAYGKVGTGLAVSTAFFGIVYMIVKRTYPHSIMEVSWVLFSFAIIIADLHRAIIGANRSWPLFVLLIDSLLLFRARKRIIVLVTTICILWLFTTAFEHAYRIGLYDLPGSPPREDRVVNTCAKPPCKTGFSGLLGGALMQITVFVVDLLLTKYFADHMQQFNVELETTINVAELVAQSLADYNLEAAMHHLDRAEVPPELCKAFTMLVTNLNAYRPYLPQSCFSRHYEESNDAMIAEYQSNTFDCCLATLIHQDIREARISMLLLNVKDTLLDVERFANSNSWLVSEALTIVTSFKGIINDLSGDRIQMSFNAARPCIRHTCAAVDSALSLCARVINANIDSTCIDVNAAVGSGTVTCGDLGCEEMRRFSIVGKLPLRLAVIERLGRKEEYPIVADMVVYKDVEQMKALRLIPHNVLFIREGHEDEASFLYEVMLVQEVAVMDAEWMYQLEMGCGQKWARYNEVGMAALRGKQYSTKGLTEEGRDMVDMLKMAPMVLQW